MNPQPTVGRIVLYRRIDDGVPVPAIIADAQDQERLTLFIMDPHGGPPDKDGNKTVWPGHFQRLVMYDHETGSPGRWSWPPRV